MKFVQEFIIVLLIIMGAVDEMWGLKCRGEDDDGRDDAEFQEAVRVCMSGDFQWNPESDGFEADFKYSQYGRGHRQRNESDSEVNRSHRQGRTPTGQHGRRSDHEERDYRTYGNPDAVRATEEPLQRMEPCAVHCVFRQIGMLNNGEMPDKMSMRHIMTRNIQDQRVKWFIEDSVDECFELFQLEDYLGKCEFAKNVALCLQEKGRRTCEDWDGSPVTQETNHSQNSSNNYNQYNQNNSNNYNQYNQNNRNYNQQNDKNHHRMH